MGKQEKVKIAIATHKMVMGGIEKSLIDLCRVLLNKGYEVTLYLESVGGELFGEIPEGIRIVDIFENYGSMEMILKRNIQEKKLASVCAAFRSYLLNCFGGDPVKSWINTSRYLETLDEQYDYAFAYGAPVSFSVIFIDKNISAGKKFVWIHNDVGQLTLDITRYRDIFKEYDKIVCVSESAKDSFLKYIPEYQSKITVFYNIIDKEKILKLAQEFVYDDGFDGIKLLTVGRLSIEKGHDLIPIITKKLKEVGLNIRWYCVGDGEERRNLETQINIRKLDSTVIILGNQQNPYPFFKMADIYIQPSRHEGYGITISEAKLFQLPIITTDFDGANEQIINGETGMIVPFGEDEIYNAIVSVVNDSNLKNYFKFNLLNDKKKCESKLEELMN